MGASYSARYREMHDLLQSQGKLTHRLAVCPDREGPREILTWQPDAAWRVAKTR